LLGVQLLRLDVKPTKYFFSASNDIDDSGEIEVQPMGYTGWMA
jgi:hypothetical protein